MLNIKYETQSVRVAGELEKGIRSGVFAPGSKLPSIREFAELFQVSTQVVKSALKLLDEKKLLVSRSRVGIFVNTEGVLPGAKRLFILHGAGGVNDCNYLARLLCFYNSNLYQHIHIHIQERTYPAGPLQNVALQYELHQAEMEHPDCLILSTGGLSRKEILEFRNFSFPILFVGDARDEALAPSEKVNQIFECTEERGEAYAESARVFGCRDVLLLSGPPSALYVEKLICGMQKESERHGIRFRCMNAARKENQDDNDHDNRERWKRIFRAAVRDGLPDGVFVDGYGRVDLVMDAASEVGLKAGKDFLLFNDVDYLPGMIHIESNYLEFAQSASEIIRRLMANPEWHCGVTEIRGKISRHPLRISTWE